MTQFAASNGQQMKLVFLFPPQAAECEGIKIFHYNSSIFFANSDLYVKALKDKVCVF